MSYGAKVGGTCGLKKKNQGLNGTYGYKSRVFMPLILGKEKSNFFTPSKVTYFKVALSCYVLALNEITYDRYPSLIKESNIKKPV